MKNFKRILALVLAVMMVATSIVAISADDAAAVSYNADAATRLEKLEIMIGTENGLELEKNVTRAEMAQFTGRVMTGEVEIEYWADYENSTTFEDLDDAKWAIGAVAYAYEQGVVIGKSDVCFDPNGDVTYQEALTMVVRSLGYTGLKYPEGFINRAIKLGLTKDIVGAKYDEPAKRGVVATILYNALYAEESLFADNFNLTSGTYMLVATPTVERHNDCKIPGASINGYIGKELNEGYVAFAPIGADNKAVNVASKYVYARVSQISDDLKGNNVDNHYADKLGYAYNLTFEGDVLTWGDECATKTFKNYGDNREITATPIDYDHKFVNGVVAWQEGWFLTFGNQAYNLVDGTKADYNAPTSTQDIILYADYGVEGLTVADYVQMFNGNDIVDEAGNVMLKWNDTLKAYFKKSVLTGDFTVKATADDILAAVACFNNSLYSDYATIQGGDVIAPAYNNGVLGTSGALNYALTIAGNYFCEITAMDYDGDGLYDAAIYTPWYVGRVKFTNSNKNFDLSGITTANGAAELLANVPQKDYVVTGVANSFTNYAPWLYKYNRNTHEINVIERATTVSGKVEWGVKGQPNATSKIFDNSEVTIGGKAWKVGGWTYSNLYGLKNFHNMDRYLIDRIAPTMMEYYGDPNLVVKNEYENGWNDVLDFGMTALCADFSGFAIAGHLISGVPTLSAAAEYAFVTFNAYQSEFTLENDQIVVDAIVDASGKYQTIKINSVDSMEFTELEYQIFVAYCDVFYANINAANKNMISVYSYYFDAERLATHQATPLYKAIERAFIIDRLTNNYYDVDGDGLADNVVADKTKTLVYAVHGQNEDGSYRLLTLTAPTGFSKANVANVTFKLGISNVGIVSGNAANTPIRTNANTAWTFVANDGIYTYVGMPANNYELNLAATTLVYVADSNNIVIFDTERCITDIAYGDVDWAEKVQDVVLNANNRCARIDRNHLDTWAFVEYVPYITATFHADEVYMVTSKTSNSKIYYENGVSYYVYANLYNLVDCKYEEAVIFTGDEIAVFQNEYNAIKDSFYENGFGEVTTNYGLIITRDDEYGVDVWTYAELKDAANANAIFNLEDAFGNATDLNRGVYGGTLKDNTNAVSHVIIDGVAQTVSNVEFVTAYVSSGKIEVGTFANIKDGAVIFYEFNPYTGVLTGYAFN